MKYLGWSKIVAQQLIILGRQFLGKERGHKSKVRAGRDTMDKCAIYNSILI